MTDATIRTSTIRDAIIMVLDEHDGEMEGTEQLAERVRCLNNKSYLVTCVRVLETNGEITIIPSIGGRGHRTVYKRNRNQPGLPRKLARTR